MMDKIMGMMFFPLIIAISIWMVERELNKDDKS